MRAAELLSVSLPLIRCTRDGLGGAVSEWFAKKPAARVRGFLATSGKSTSAQGALQLDFRRTAARAAKISRRGILFSESTVPNMPQNKGVVAASCRYVIFSTPVLHLNFAVGDQPVKST